MKSKPSPLKPTADGEGVKGQNFTEFPHLSSASIIHPKNCAVSKASGPPRRDGRGVVKKIDRPPEAHVAARLVSANEGLAVT
jgi:hypothetical protein